MLEHDMTELFRIARACLSGNPNRNWFSVTDRDGSKLTIRLEEAENPELSLDNGND